MASLLDKINKKTADKKTADKKAASQDIAKDTVREKERAADKKVGAKSSSSFLPYKVLLRPLVSEKGTYLQEQNKYFFEVAKDANKIMVKQAVEQIYNVEVVKVNIQNRIGKRVRFGRVSGRRKNWKRAVVTLKPGQRITTVEGV